MFLVCYSSQKIKKAKKLNTLFVLDRMAKKQKQAPQRKDK